MALKTKIILLAIALFFVSVSSSHAANYYVSITGNDGNPGTRNEPLKTIQAGAGRANPGDFIRLLPGRYVGPILIAKSGQPERPITIISDSNNKNDYAIIEQGIRLENTSWFVLKNLKFHNSPKEVIDLYNATYISVQGCEIIGGTRAINIAGNNSHHLLAENNYWIQDRRIWTTWEWKACHDNQAPCRHPNGYGFNGSFVGTKPIEGKGSYIIRYNTVEHVFNFFQMWSDTPNEHANIEVYGNKVDHVMDNSIEPENHVFNWHVYHNEINNCGGGMSLIHDGATDGGPMYIYGNYGYRNPNDIPGTQNDKRPFRVLKTVRWQEKGVFMYHNSWDYKTWSQQGASNDRMLKHFNNIGAFEEGYRMPGWTFTESNKNEFDYDISNKPWPNVITGGRQEAHGIVADPKFINAVDGDFRLQAGSPAIDAGKVIPGFTQSYEGSAPDIGAFEGNKLVEGPPFYVQVPSGGLGYEEKPRITRHRINGQEMRIYFSWAIRANTISKDAVILKADGIPITILNVSVGNNGREVIIQTGTALAGKKLELSFSSLPVGENGETATMWASTVGISNPSEIVSIPPSDIDPSLPSPSIPPLTTSNTKRYFRVYLKAKRNRNDPQTGIADIIVPVVYDSLQIKLYRAVKNTDGEFTLGSEICNTGLYRRICPVFPFQTIGAKAVLTDPRYEITSYAWQQGKEILHPAKQCIFDNCSQDSVVYFPVQGSSLDLGTLTVTAQTDSGEDLVYDRIYSINEPLAKILNNDNTAAWKALKGDGSESDDVYNTYQGNKVIFRRELIPDYLLKDEVKIEWLYDGTIITPEFIENNPQLAMTLAEDGSTLQFTAVGDVGSYHSVTTRTLKQFSEDEIEVLEKGWDILDSHTLVKDTGISLKILAPGQTPAEEASLGFFLASTVKNAPEYLLFSIRLMVAVIILCCVVFGISYVLENTAEGQKVRKK